MLSRIFRSFAADFKTKGRMSDTILTITGSDGTGGSGVQADIRLISEMGGRAVSAVTSITVQNTLGIDEFYDLPADVVRLQLESIINDLQPQVVKVGLLRRIDVVETVADVLRRYKPRHIIYAPVLKSSQGDLLVSPETYAAIEGLLLPLCTVVLTRKDLPEGEPSHGRANRFASAVAVGLSRGESVEEAIDGARNLLRQAPAEYADAGSRSAELYNLFLDAVERFFHRYADVSFYAEQLNVSPRYLSQVTRRIAGRSPKSIIDERLTAEIVKYLTTTGTPLKTVARQLGFSSQAQLSRYFRKQRGVSPRQYKLTSHNTTT